MKKKGASTLIWFGAGILVLIGLAINMARDEAPLGNYRLNAVGMCAVGLGTLCVALGILKFAIGRDEVDRTPAEAVGAAERDGPNLSVESRIRRLDQMKTSGLVSEQEFQEQRRRILEAL